MPFDTFWRGRRVLVTGHTGFKGSWLCAWLDALGAQVSGIALPPADHQRLLFDRLDLPARVSSAFIDLTCGGRVARSVEEVDPEIVFHLAAQPLVLEALAQPLATFATNVMGTANLLDALREPSRVRAVVVVTTDKCYRDPQRQCAEDDPLGGREPYGASKACAELVAEAYRRCYLRADAGIGLATARAGNVIGGGDMAPGRLLPDLVRAHAQGRPAELRQPMAVRPWQHVLDALAGYLLLAERLVEDPAAYARPWNFGPPDEVTWTAARVADEAALHLPGLRWRRAAENDAGPRETMVLRLSAERARYLLGWQPLLATAEAIEWAIAGYAALARGETAWLGRQIGLYQERAAALQDDGLAMASPPSVREADHVRA